MADVPATMIALSSQCSESEWSLASNGLRNLTGLRKIHKEDVSVNVKSIIRAR